MAKKSIRYCVVYRTGGTENFKWHRSTSCDRLEAECIRISVETGGCKALLVEYDKSVAIGLPETYEP